MIVTLAVLDKYHQNQPDKYLRMYHLEHNVIMKGLRSTYGLNPNFPCCTHRKEVVECNRMVCVHIYTGEAMIKKT